MDFHMNFDLSLDDLVPRPRRQNNLKEDIRIGRHDDLDVVRDVQDVGNVQ